MSRAREIATAVGIAFVGLVVAVSIALREIDRATSYPAGARR